ncbi:PEP-CTERM sorting domain-containing protein [Aquabacterium sp.]|uniref:PEP-CTERM sorting domain-containing protein n=1 Tax=Aquabacterium sp. TaxID=1872578 RepID=UPI004038402F
MTSWFKPSLAASMFMGIGLVHAAAVTIPSGTDYQGTYFGGGAVNMAFYIDLLQAWDDTKASLSSYGAASVTVLKDTDGFYESAGFSAPLTSLTIDDNSNKVLSLATTGGITVLSPNLFGMSSGGSLTVTDLNIDLANKKVYANVIGGNGVGTLSNFYLWDIGSMTGPTILTGNGADVTTMTGLKITAAGSAVLEKSLGLMIWGKPLYKYTTDYGTITVVAVPEPSTSALMGLGLAGLLISKRRRQGRSFGR